MSENRPNPDNLLARVTAEEQRQGRGKLKIFFGACAGVGKTYAMLEAARARKTEGIDVAIGIVETHKRKETEALVSGLEILPPKAVEYRGAKLREFDLEGALHRKPALLLLDELAHTNAEGCKNVKRWQDVSELLDAGINIYTTVNVQHVETLNDVVAKITGVIVRETIPDSIVEHADEIELIDLPPDDLLQRLNEGKVYLPEQAQHAAGNFFRKGNLTALRELALRATADRVNAQVQHYRQEKSIAGTWPTAERILVCVGPSPFSAHLVRAARRMAAGLHAEWIAVSVETPAHASLSERARQQLKQNLRLAEQLGGETVTLQGSGVVEKLAEYAHSRNVTKIITGKPTQPRWRERIYGNLVDDLIRKTGDIDVYVIKGDAEADKPARILPLETRVDWHRYGWAAAVIGVCSLLAFAMFHHFDLSNLIMVYLLGVVVVSARFGRGPAIFASIASVAAFDFFFVKPYLTFAVSDSQYLVTFAVMLIVGIFISSLTVRIRRQAEDASLREQHTAQLYNMARPLSSSRGMENLLAIAVQHIAEVFESDVVGLLADSSGRLVAHAGNDAMFAADNRERGVAQWVFDLGKPAGLGTDTLPSAEALYIPLIASRAPIGVVGLRPRRVGCQFDAEQMHLLEAFARQAALAIECDRLVDEAQRAQLAADSEKSRNALLSSVSHDLRTPLATICGAASSLRDEQHQLRENTRRDLVETIHEESNRLSRMVANLLEMTKLESGAAAVKKEWCPLEEVVGSALTRLEKTLQGRPVMTKLPLSLPLVPLDVVLMEQVFVNLLENAAKYTPAGSPIEIIAAAAPGEVTVQILDRGPGLIAGEESKVFEKFFRGGRTGNAVGTGLGLAICRGIVQAHGGRIWATNRADGGVQFSFTLPVKDKPPSATGLPAHPIEAEALHG